MEENQDGDMVSVRKTTGWRQYIDYRRLNSVIKKDNFPLHFIDQMIERLTGRVYYCFLDNFSEYFQIAIAPEGQEEITFTCPIWFVCLPLDTFRSLKCSISFSSVHGKYFL